MQRAHLLIYGPQSTAKKARDDVQHTRRSAAEARRGRGVAGATGQHAAA
jgi:hypothetical protein